MYTREAIRAQGILSESDLEFRWLPMAHSFGKVLMSTQMACGFAAAIDGRVEKIVDNLGVVKPTFMGAAPRIFEKAYGRIQTMQAAEGGAKEKIFNKAFEVGTRVDELRLEGKSWGLGYYTELLAPLLQVADLRRVLGRSIERCVRDLVVGDRDLEAVAERLQ